MKAPRCHFFSTHQPQNQASENQLACRSPPAGIFLVHPAVSSAAPEWLARLPPDVFFRYICRRCPGNRTLNCIGYTTPVFDGFRRNMPGGRSHGFPNGFPPVRCRVADVRARPAPVASRRRDRSFMSGNLHKNKTHTWKQSLRPVSLSGGKAWMTTPCSPYTDAWSVPG